MKNIFLHISKQSFPFFPFLSLFALINEKKKNTKDTRSSIFNILSNPWPIRNQTDTWTREKEREREREELYIVWEAGSRVKGEAINRLTSLRATSALYSAVRTGPRIY